jgi:phosphoglycerate dehydrogenase-like enzyme
VEDIDRFYSREELPRVAAEIDYLIVLVPYSPETHKIVNAKVLSAMKPTAYLINIARGQVIDEEALIEALKNKKIAGAGLDVFNEEPLPKDHPFWGMENVIVSPHVAGMSNIYAEQLLPIFEENLRRFLKGERRNLINRVEW